LNHSISENTKERIAESIKSLSDALNFLNMKKYL
jgi:hypothetical protein